MVSPGEKCSPFSTLSTFILTLQAVQHKGSLEIMVSQFSIYLMFTEKSWIDTKGVQVVEDH